MHLSEALSIFGLSSISTAKEVKAVYRKLSKENHPDLGGDVKKMQAINLAYELLAQKCTKDMVSRQDRIKSYKEQKEANKAMMKEAGDVMFSFIDLDAISERLELIFHTPFIVIDDVIQSNDAIYAYSADSGHRYRFNPDTFFSSFSQSLVLLHVSGLRQFSHRFSS
jgi:DnaJ-class molecular chaperone